MTGTIKAPKINTTISITQKLSVFNIAINIAVVRTKTI
jgi:hypothetical protein